MIFFFFFKQKTAYEMRISDWSSDVCSSDLAMNAATNRRFESLDAIRGVAVMGILAMNIVAFALPFSAYSNPAAGGPPAPADLATWARSAERRVGQECGSTCRYRVSPYL